MSSVVLRARISLLKTLQTRIAGGGTSARRTHMRQIRQMREMRQMRHMTAGLTRGHTPRAVVDAGAAASCAPTNGRTRN